MALLDVQEQVRAAIYDTVRLQFVLFSRVSVDIAASGAGLGQSGTVLLAGFAGSLLGDYVLFGGEDSYYVLPHIRLWLPHVSVAGTISFGFNTTTAGAEDPAANITRVTVLRAM